MRAVLAAALILLASVAVSAPTATACQPNGSPGSAIVCDVLNGHGDLPGDAIDFFWCVFSLDPASCFL